MILTGRTHSGLFVYAVAGMEDGEKVCVWNGFFPSREEAYARGKDRAERMKEKGFTPLQEEE